ncbi:MAG: phosphate/phosphite/phosphonate ABC transporter substrate-binding protein [Gammaproteobacteria bacterium]|nr:phosphate/phosphite/phosphonate ABC transporter substrate-binding protein [Gammaproteobacteria bacterium]
MKKFWYALIAAVLGVTAVIYFLLQANVQDQSLYSVINVGVLPDESMDQLNYRYSPLIEYLSQQTGRSFELVPATDYNHLLTLFIEQKVDLAYLGGLTFLQSAAQQNVVPLVMRDVDMRFTSYFLVDQDSRAQDLSDLKDMPFSFGSELSTSGHLMPRHFLQLNHQIVPEDFFSEVRYSGAHDKTAYLVRDGQVELGVANSEIVRSMLRDGRLGEQDIRIIWETPPYPDYVWAVHEHLPADIRLQLQEAFLQLDSNDDQHLDILSRMGARVFLPAGIGDFQSLRQVAESLDILTPN